MEILAFDMSSLFANALHILYVALGLGLVIFFHELGHFAVAKWCGVLVEKFSLGFGPVLWSFKRGDTEYALSAIPFGGFVKMLGQDDMDATQLANEDIAADPNSYTSKSVSQRMAIISAGVIMNIITGMLFFAGAFHFGVETSPPKVGQVVNGTPAWANDFQPGDTITRINGRDVHSFRDILRGTTLSVGEMRIEGVHEDGKTFDVTLEPNRGMRRTIGVAPAVTTKIGAIGRENPISARPGTAAAASRQKFQKDDDIVAVRTVPLTADEGDDEEAENTEEGGDGKQDDTESAPDAEDGDANVDEAGNRTGPVHELEVEGIPELRQFLARHRMETIEIDVRRGDTTETVRIDPQHFKEVGIWFDIERISAIKPGSPAASAGLQIGDRLTSINGRDIGTEINPLFLADYVEPFAGEEIEITVKRDVEGAPEPETKTINLTPGNEPAWLAGPAFPDAPLALPSLGLTYHLNSRVVKVIEGSPAAKAGIKDGMSLKSVSINSANKEYLKRSSGDPLEIDFDDEEEDNNVAFAWWEMQVMPDAKATLQFEGVEDKFELSLKGSQSEYCMPIRGIVLAPESFTLNAESAGEAFGMATHRTWNTAIDIYLTLRNLAVGELSAKNLRGPIGIFQVGYQVSQQGLPRLLLFLGFLSVNLAVLNFLPIPVLDGGHMVFLIWEGVTRKRPSEKVHYWAQIAGLLFVVSLMLFVIFLDVFIHKFKV